MGIEGDAPLHIRGDARLFPNRGASFNSGSVDDALAAVLDHVGELVPEMLQEALHRPGRRVAERADRVALDLVGDLHQQVEVGQLALPGQDPAQHAREPAGALAARRALAAGFGHVEARDALEHSNHAGRFVHDDHRARADAAARLRTSRSPSCSR
jgi:hypothetical protein